MEETKNPTPLDAFNAWILVLLLFGAGLMDFIKGHIGRGFAELTLTALALSIATAIVKPPRALQWALSAGFIAIVAYWVFH